jgi:Protein of unknown function with PCYCGC motif
MKVLVKPGSYQYSPVKRSLILLGVVIITASALGGCNGTSTAPPPSTPTSQRDHSVSATPRIPAYIANIEKARPLPKVLDPAHFSDPIVVKAYRYAQKNPELFAQQPCYCYCDAGNGHRSLLDCFATDHSAG